MPKSYVSCYLVNRHYSLVLFFSATLLVLQKFNWKVNLDDPGMSIQLHGLVLVLYQLPYITLRMCWFIVVFSEMRFRKKIMVPSLANYLVVYTKGKKAICKLLRRE